MAEADIVVLVEEASACEIVKAISRQLGLAGRVKVLKHQGVGDLKKSIANKIGNDPFPSTKFLVLCDADLHDCRTLKASLIEQVPKAKRERTMVRIVCRELEAWYIAQPEALKKSGTLARNIWGGTQSRNPDEIVDPKREFLRIAHEKGQMEHARSIGPHLDPDHMKSASFQHFVKALVKLAAK